MTFYEMENQINPKREAHWANLIKRYEQTRIPWTIEEIERELHALQEFILFDFPNNNLTKTQIHKTLDGITRVCIALTYFIRANNTDINTDFITENLYFALKELENNQFI